MTLTDLQRHALYLSSLKGGAVVVRKRTSGGKHVTTRQANVLERKGLVTRHEDILLITKEGRRELNAVLPEDPPVYLRSGDGLTTRRDLAQRDEAEVTDPATLKGFWAEESERRRQGSRRATESVKLTAEPVRDEREAEIKRLAFERGKDISEELKRVELTRKAHDRAVRAAERKVREDEAA
jgi:hypothetical protein